MLIYMAEKVTNEELARMVAKGFDGVDQRFDQMASKEDLKRLATKEDLEQVKIDLENKMNRLEVGISDIKDGVVPKLDFEDLEGRVKYVETKLSIESGK